MMDLRRLSITPMLRECKRKKYPALPRLRVRGLGVGTMYAVFILTIVLAEMLCFNNTLVQSDKLNEKTRQIERVQRLLDEEGQKTAPLDKQLAALPPPCSGTSCGQTVQASGDVEEQQPQKAAMDTSLEAAHAVESQGTGRPAPLVVPVIVISCCRPEYLNRTLSLIQERMTSLEGIEFQMIVSNDGMNGGVQSLMRTEYPRIKYMHYIERNLMAGNSRGGSNSYSRIARHYKWALGRVFENQDVEWAIVLEDDIEIAPDFFHFMAAGAELLKKDSTLWTVSAWNDNSFPGMVHSPTSVYRSDFFGGLGWIMTRSLWQELGPKWPDAYWDDWMRLPEQRQGRACIRPEISRTSTFGKIGSSGGQFFQSHLSRMVLNSQPVNFTREDWSHLIKANYDGPFLKQVAAAPLTSLQSLQTGSAKLTYNNLATFKTIARKLGIMDDEKAGVPRTAYLGVVTLRRKDSSLLHIAPESGSPYYVQ